MKLFGAILQWVIILAILPGIKAMIDAGVPLLQAQGVAASDIAWIGVLPWLLPMGWFVGTIIWMIKPSQPKIPVSQNTSGRGSLF